MFAETVLAVVGESELAAVVIAERETGIAEPGESGIEDPDIVVADFRLK